MWDLSPSYLGSFHRGPSATILRILSFYIGSYYHGFGKDCSFWYLDVLISSATKMLCGLLLATGREQRPRRQHRHRRRWLEASARASPGAPNSPKYCESFNNCQYSIPVPDSNTAAVL